VSAFCCRSFLLQKILGKAHRDANRSCEHLVALVTDRGIAARRS
jgi:hypothetical protein